MKKTTIVFPECFTRDTNESCEHADDQDGGIEPDRPRTRRVASRIVPAMAGECAADEFFGYAGRSHSNLARGRKQSSQPFAMA
jgi:hypothetical protein